MKKITVRIGLVLLLFGGLLTLGCGGKADARGEKAQKPREGRGFSGKSPTQMASAIPVEASFITNGDISDYLMFSAALETEQTVTVYSQINGLVVRMFVEEGQWVQKGDSLLQIDPREYILAEEKARVEYEKQLSNFRRLEGLKEKDLVSNEEYETARLNMKQAEIAWKQAKLNLEYTTVRAPFSGVIGERLVNLGARIQPSTALFTISNLAQKIVKVYVPQNDMAKVHRGQQAVITSDVLPHQQFEGWVKRISPIVDPQSGTFKVTVGVRDRKNLLKPGMFVNVHLIVDTHQDVPIIPKTALIYENEKSFFFIIQENQVQKIALQKGYEDAEKVEIKNNIPPETPVVVVGQNGLKDGNRVRVTNIRRYPWQSNFPEEKGNRLLQAARQVSKRPMEKAKSQGNKGGREKPSHVTDQQSSANENE